MDANLTKLVKKVERMMGHPATDPNNPAVVPATGVFDRDDIEDVMSDHRVDAVRFALDYTLSQNLSGATTVWTPLAWWADDAILQDYNWQLVVADTPQPLIGRWDFNAPHIYPLYLTGRTYDLHGVAADLLDDWAAKVKLEHNLSIGALSLKREGKFSQLQEMATTHRKKMRFGSVRVHDDSVLSPPGQGKAWRQATAPPPM